MEHVNDCCFRDIYKGGLWEEDLDVCAQSCRGDWLPALLNTYRNLRFLPAASRKPEHRKLSWSRLASSSIEHV